MRFSRIREDWQKLRRTISSYRPYKYFFLCLLLPLAILVSLSAIYYCNYSYRTRANLQQTAQDRMSSVSTFLNSTVKKVQVNSRLLISSQGFYDLFYNVTTKEDTTTIYTAAKTLLNYNATLDMVDNSFLYLRGQKTVLSSDGLTNESIFFNRSYVFTTYKGNYWAGFDSASYGFSLLPPTVIAKITSADSTTITRHRVIPVVTAALTESKSNNLFVVCLNQDTLDNALQNYREYDDEVIIVTDKSGSIIASTDHTKAQEMLADPKVKQHLLASDSDKSEQINVHNNSYVFSTGVSSFSYAKYHFISAVPKSSFYKPMQTTNLFFLIIICMTAATFAMLIFVFRRYILNPMQTLVGSIAHKGTETGANDSNIVDFLANRVGDMQKDISALVPILSEQHLLSLMTNPDAAAQSLPYSSSVDSLPHAHFCVATVQAQFSPSFWTSFTDEDRHKVIKFLLQVLKVQLSKGYVCHVINLQKNQIAIVLNIPEQFKAEELISELSTVLDFFKYDASLIRFSAGISRSCVELPMLHLAYREARAAMDSVPDAGPAEQCIQIYSGSTDRVYYTFTTAQDNQLYYSILQGSYADAHAVLNSIVEQNAAKHLPHSEAVKLRQYIFACICRAVKASGNLMPWNDSFHDISNDFDSADADTVNTFLHELIDRTAQKAAPRRQFSIKDVTDYIDTHYQEDLYLEYVAEKFGVTDKYLSKAFKESVHVNFHDYLNRVRMDVAKKLLTTTKQTVTEVGQAVGFNTHSTFFRVFKSLEGISPTDYRRLNQH